MMPMTALATQFAPNKESELKLENQMAHAGHGYKNTRIEHHSDGSHTVEHEHEDGKSHKKYAVASLDHVHDGLQDHLGMANDGEAEAEAGQSGIEGEAAPAAGA